MFLAISQSTHCRNRLQSPADAAPAEHSSGHRGSERRPQAVHHLRTVPNASLGVLCGATGWGGTRQKAPGSPPKQLSLSIGAPKKSRKSQISIVSKLAHVFFDLSSDLVALQEEIDSFQPQKLWSPVLNVEFLGVSCNLNGSTVKRRR